MFVRGAAGFSVIEVVIGTAILSILAVAAVPSLQQAVAAANNAATHAYVHHVIKGVEMARNNTAFRIPERQSCAALIHIRDNPTSVASCTYEPDLKGDTYTITATSVTGKTFHYDGSEIIALP